MKDPVPPDIYLFQTHFLLQNYSLNQTSWSSTPTIPKMGKPFRSNNLINVTDQATKTTTLTKVMPLTACKDTMKWV